MSKILITITLSTLISCSTSISQPQFSDFGLVTVINHPDHGYYYWTDKNNPSICYIDNNNDGVVDTIINHVGMNKNQTIQVTQLSIKIKMGMVILITKKVVVTIKKSE